MSKKFLLSILLILLAISQISAEKVGVLFVGTSITGSADGYYSYRYHVWKGLEGAGWNRSTLDFKGTYEGVGQTYGQGHGLPAVDTSVSWWDWDHQGIWGIFASEMKDDIKDFIYEDSAGVVPNVLVVELGTNDIIGGRTPKQITDDIRSLVDTIRNRNCEVVVVLTKIMPIRGLSQTKTDSLASFNNVSIPALAASLNRVESPVFIADQFTNFPAAGIGGDGIHPTHAGELELGSRFTNVLKPILENFRSFTVRMQNNRYSTSLVNSVFPITATASSPAGIKKISFYANEVLLGSGSRSGTQFVYNLRSTVSGIANIYAIAEDSLGKTHRSDSVRLAICQNGIIESATIPQIQGSASLMLPADMAISPYLAKKVNTTGIVTAVEKDGKAFWIQSEVPDTKLSTSEAVYIVLAGYTGYSPASGDKISITGIVDELTYDPFNGSLRPAFSKTTVSFVELVTLISSGNSLPAAYNISDIMPKDDQNTAYGYYKWLEGMLVSVNKGKVVGASDKKGTFSMVAGGGALSGSGYYRDITKSINEKRGSTVDYNPEVILAASNLLTTPLSLNSGDTIVRTVGVVDYIDGLYKMQLLKDSTTVSRKSFPTGTVSYRNGPTGVMTVTSFNLGNLCDTVDNPGYNEPVLTTSELSIKLSKLKSAITGSEMRKPAVIAVQGVENLALLQRLADSVNFGNPAILYVPYLPSGNDVRGVLPGFLVDSRKITVESVLQLATATGFDSICPTARPIIGRFSYNGNRFYVVNFDLIDKSADPSLMSPDFLYYAHRISEEPRAKQATAISNEIKAMLSYDPTCRIIVAGDMSDYLFAENNESSTPYSILMGETITGAPLLKDYSTLANPSAGAYTKIGDGRGQLFKSLLVSPALTPVGYNILHFNSGFSDMYKSDTSTPVKCSDSDPVEVRF